MFLTKKTKGFSPAFIIWGTHYLLTTFDSTSFTRDKCWHCNISIKSGVEAIPPFLRYFVLHLQADASPIAHNATPPWLSPSWSSVTQVLCQCLLIPQHCLGCFRSRENKINQVYFISRFISRFISWFTHELHWATGIWCRVYEELSPDSGWGCVHFTNNDCSQVGEDVRVLLWFGEKITWTLPKSNTPKAIGTRIAPGGLK